MKNERVKKSLEKSKNILEKKRKIVKRKFCIEKRHTFTIIAMNFVQEQLKTIFKQQLIIFNYWAANFQVDMQNNGIKMAKMYRTNKL